MLKTVSSITNAIGALNYKGTWNASTNTPTIVSSVGVKGDYYVVSVSGTTAINGISNWGVGDWITFNGSVWQRVEGGADLNGVNITFTGTASGPTYETSNATAGLTITNNDITADGTDTNIDIDIAPKGSGNAVIGSGNLAFGTSGNGIRGTTTNDSANTGVVGEIVSSTVPNTTVSLTSTVTADLTSISLTAGDWDVQGSVVFDIGATTNVTYYYSSVSTVSNTLGTVSNVANPSGGTVYGATAFNLLSPIARISISSTTTVYLATNVGFTVSTVNAGGTIRARRVR